MAGIGEQANAAVVYSGVVNIPIPNTFSGVYMNLVTGVTSGGGFATQDINPYYAAALMWMGGDTFNHARGTGTAADNCVAGSVISLTTSTFVAGAFPTMGNFTTGTAGIYGMRFRNEVTGVDNVAWVRIIKQNQGSGISGTIVEYAYENTGADILAGDTGVGSCALPLPHPGCIADTNNSGAVDVNDLLAVIGHWGNVGPPRPIGDVAPAPNGDCLVNVNDLLAVVGTWGNCPIPTGACCAPAGTCTSATQTACTTGGGTYQGNGSSCGSVVCPVVPANDNCAGAITLTMAVSPAAPASNSGNNANATVDPTTPGGACIAGGATFITRDVWFKHVVPSTPGLAGQILQFDMCNTLAPFTDSTINVYTGTCAGLTEVGCNDDSCGLLSSVGTPMVPAGTTVFVRVGSWSTGATNQGPLVLRARATNVTDDICQGANVLAIGGSATGTLASATQDIAPSCAGVPASIGKWYKVVGNGTTLTASTCNSTSDVYDGVLAVYCAGALGCNVLNCLAASNTDVGNKQGPNCTAFQGEKVTFCSVANLNYFILVGVGGTGLPGGVTGQYTLQVTSNGIPGCSSPVDCNAGSPPVYDECATALVVNVGSTQFNNAIATPASGTGTICGQPWSKDVWFRYTSANGGPASVTITPNAPNAGFWDSVIEVYAGSACPPAGAPLGCVDDDPSCFGCHGTVNWTATAGTTYTIRVASWSTSFGALGNLVITDP